MDNEYSAYEPEEEEKKKFKITRGMIILATVILLAIVVVIVIIVIHNNNKPREITETDYKNLETHMMEEAPGYVDEITESVSRVTLDTLKEENPDVFNEEDLPAIKVCDGYVNVYSNDGEEMSDPFISCGDKYKTEGYVDESEGDVIKPIIKLKGKSKMTINQGDNYVEPGATATDDTDGDLTSKIVITGKVDTAKPKTYIIKYSVEDAAGNKATKKRTVVVKAIETTTTTTTTTSVVTTTAKAQTTKKNTSYRTTKYVAPTTKATTNRVTTPPTISIKGANPYNITQGQTYVDPGATATDALGKSITGKITKTGTVNTNVAKTYYITYKVVDDYKNSATAVRTVKVNPKTNVTSISVTPNS